MIVEWQRQQATLYLHVFRVARSWKYENTTQMQSCSISRHEKTMNNRSSRGLYLVYLSASPILCVPLVFLCVSIYWCPRGRMHNPVRAHVEKRTRQGMRETRNEGRRKTPAKNAISCQECRVRKQHEWSGSKPSDKASGPFIYRMGDPLVRIASIAEKRARSCLVTIVRPFDGLGAGDSADLVIEHR